MLPSGAGGDEEQSRPEMVDREDSIEFDDPSNLDISSGSVSTALPTLQKMLRALLDSFAQQLRLDLRDELREVGRHLHADLSNSIKDLLKDAAQGAVERSMSGHLPLVNADAVSKGLSVDNMDIFVDPPRLPIGKAHPSLAATAAAVGSIGGRPAGAGRSPMAARRREVVQTPAFSLDTEDDEDLDRLKTIPLGGGLRGAAFANPTAPSVSFVPSPPEAPPILTFYHGTPGEEALAHDANGRSNQADEAAGEPRRTVAITEDEDAGRVPGCVRETTLERRRSSSSEPVPFKSVPRRKTRKASKGEDDDTLPEGGVRRPSKGRLDISIEMARHEKKKGGARKSLWQMSIAEMMKSPKFDNIVGASILLNAATIGLQTDHAARNLTDKATFEMEVMEYVFCVWFTSELLLKIYVYKCSMWNPMREGFFWNCFDTLVVSAQLFEMLVAAASAGLDQFRLLRVLRILRLVRILRVVRVLHLISELRAIVSSIVGSFRSLLWTVVLLLLMIYIVAVYFTQCVTQHILEKRESGNQGKSLDEFLTSGETDLSKFFGSIGRAVLSLWQAMSGGMDWDTLAGPLLDDIGFVQGLLFASYIGFSLLALMNVVTGVFVQTALQSAMKEEDAFMTDQIINLFRTADKDHSATISWEEITESLEDPATAREWQSIGVQREEAMYLFRLLDLEGNGEVAFDEFLGGCLRLNGPAKSFDLLTVMQENRRHQDKMDSLVEAVDSISDSCHACTDMLRMHAATIERLEKCEYQSRESLEKNLMAVKFVVQHISNYEHGMTEVKEMLRPIAYLETLRDFLPEGNQLV